MDVKKHTNSSASIFDTVWRGTRMLWTRIRLLFHRSISSRKFFPQWIIPLVSFAIPLLIFSVILWVNNNGWRFNGNSPYDVTEGGYNPENIIDAAFYHMFTNGGQNLFPSHFWGAIVTVIGIFVIAILTSTITNYLEQKAKMYISGELSYYLDNHIIILGASDVLYSIIEQVSKKRENKGAYFLIQTGKDVEKTRREVFSFLSEGIDRNKLIFIYGDRTSLNDIKELYPKNAKEVFIIGDASENENGESYRDAYNIDSVETIVQVLKESPRKDPLLCHIMFEYQTTFSAFQNSDISTDIQNHILFEPFNFYEMWAQKVLLEDGRYNRLDQTGVVFSEKNKSIPLYIDAQSDKSVHLIIVGMSKMGLAFALEAAQVCHFPNFITKGKKTRITFIDKNASNEQEFLGGRFGSLKRLSKWRCLDSSSPDFAYQNDWSEVTTASGDDWLDIEWEFITGRIEQDSVRKYLSDACSDNNHIVTIAICLAESHQSIATALYLPEIVYQNCLQILVYQRLSGRVVNQISSNKTGRYNNMRPFGMIDDAFSSLLTDDNAAMMVNYAYGKVYDTVDSMRNEALLNPDIDIKGLPSMLNWDEIDYKLSGFNSDLYAQSKGWRKEVVKRWSSRFNAQSIDVKLRSVHAEQLQSIDSLNDVLMMKNNLYNLIRVEHNRWVIEKLLAGYREYSQEEKEMVDNYRYGSEEWDKAVKKLKNGPEKAHFDICDYASLIERDPNAIPYDEVLIRTIPYIKFKKLQS